MKDICGQIRYSLYDRTEMHYGLSGIEYSLDSDDVTRWDYETELVFGLECLVQAEEGFESMYVENKPVRLTARNILEQLCSLERKIQDSATRLMKDVYAKKPYISSSLDKDASDNAMGPIHLVCGSGNLGIDIKIFDTSSPYEQVSKIKASSRRELSENDFEDIFSFVGGLLEDGYAVLDIEEGFRARYNKRARKGFFSRIFPFAGKRRIKIDKELPEFSGDIKSLKKARKILPYYLSRADGLEEIIFSQEKSISRSEMEFRFLEQEIASYSTKIGRLDKEIGEENARFDKVLQEYTAGHDDYPDDLISGHQEKIYGLEQTRDDLRIYKSNKEETRLVNESMLDIRRSRLKKDRELLEELRKQIRVLKTLLLQKGL